MAQPKKKKPGRPKGSKNKAKKPGRPKGIKNVTKKAGRPKESENVTKKTGRPKGSKNKVGRPKASAPRASTATRTVTISASLADKIQGLTLLGKGSSIEAALDKLIK
jgi:hypothetical protein